MDLFHSLLGAFDYEFMRNAVLAGILASVVCGIIGTFVVVKRLVFISGGISHAAFGGLGFCYFLGWPPLTGAFAVAGLVAVALGAERSEKLRSHDAAIGVLWAVGMAIGIVFIYKTPGYAPNLMSYLFGDILTVARQDIYAMLALDGAVLLVLALLHKELLAVSFDPTFAHVQGVPVRIMQTLLLFLVGSAIVVLIQVVGIILVIALLTIPTLIALRVSQRFNTVLVLSCVVSLLMVLTGLAVSYLYDLPTGPGIVLIGITMLAAIMLWQQLRQRRQRALALG